MKNLNKQSGSVQIFIVLAVVVLAAAGFIYYSKNTVPVKKEIATDPNFKEVKGELLPGFPTDFPIYPGATLVGSSNNNVEGKPDNGYRVKWTSHDGVVKVMAWYLQELTKNKWIITEKPTDPASSGEQATHIEKNGLSGFVAAENEGAEGEVEIVVDLNKTK